jgi:hypothetical protein
VVTELSNEEGYAVVTDPSDEEGPAVATESKHDDGEAMITNIKWSTNLLRKDTSWSPSPCGNHRSDRRKYCVVTGPSSVDKSVVVKEPNNVEAGLRV